MKSARLVAAVLCQRLDPYRLAYKRPLVRGGSSRWTRRVNARGVACASNSRANSNGRRARCVGCGQI
jgi:hypothetical protein